ncbi:hypothetical protein HU200_052784 [Digitaria exilis]|uniref:Protein kinase domain-containing protein n=1 Tax=Digitaria exilis TaxID=1010633 RepID=A0A835AIJ0_9POAL|nr:hypothetical protein HU200_052784 [Digitaria exilis]
MKIVLLLPLLLAALVSPWLPATAARDCLKTCGDVNITYPFGIGHDCYLKIEGSDQQLQPFNVNCSDRGDDGSLLPKPIPIIDGNMEVLSIDVLNGKVRVKNLVNSLCYNTSTRSMNDPIMWSYEMFPAFRVSDTDNKLTISTSARESHALLTVYVSTPLEATMGVCFLVLLGTIMSCTYAIREKKRLAAIKRLHFKQHGGFLLFKEMKSRQGQGHSFTLFTKEELEDATNKFDERYVLGKGGNGTVYLGNLKDGRAVAIKRCRVADDERQRQEFGKEMLILSQVNHRNIVKLYGCCLEVEVPMLVYQFIPNGTLYQLIHRDGPPPPFAVRLKIAHETAEALAYLHSMASPPIIHGDMKSPNILLDENYTVKVSDFGSSVLAPTDNAHLVTLVQGTCGYLDPEYMQTCRLTDKSDVYSFGVILLELLTRRKALTMAAPEEERSLAAYFLSSMRDGKLDGLLDVCIRDEVKGDVIKMVATLAKKCLDMSSEKRPSMREVAEELDTIRKICGDMCLGEIIHSSVLIYS